MKTLQLLFTSLNNRKITFWIEDIQIKYNKNHNFLSFPRHFCFVNIQLTFR